MDQLLAQPLNQGLHFFEVDRYFFPWIFPALLLASAALARLPRGIAVVLMVLYIAGVLWFYPYLVAAL